MSLRWCETWSGCPLNNNKIVGKEASYFFGQYSKKNDHCAAKLERKDLCAELELLRYATGKTYNELKASFPPIYL